jgi:hypothetical protein
MSGTHGSGCVTPCLPRARIHCSPRCGCSSGFPIRLSSATVASVRSGFCSKGIGQALEPGFLQEHNPIVRHTVLLRRRTLEDAGLLERIGVDVHPDPEAPTNAYTGVEFSGLGLLTNLPFDLAYQAAEAFTTALPIVTDDACRCGTGTASLHGY